MQSKRALFLSPWPLWPLSAFSLALSAPAVAQAPERIARPLEEVVVVAARRVEEDIQSVPLAITALSGDALRNQSVTHMQDLSAAVPNLLIRPAAADPSAVYLGIRGQVLGDALLTVDSPIGLYFDDVNVPRTYGMAGALVDIQRVEVLRGPQGTLYGRNTTGGAISFFTTDPTDQLGGYIDLKAGNYGLRNVTGVANLPITEALAVRFAAQKGERDGYGKDGLGRDAVDDDSQYYRGKLKLDLERFTALLTVDYGELDNYGGLSTLSGLTPATDTLPPGGLATLETAAQLGLDPTDPANLGIAYAALLEELNRGDFYRNGGNYEHQGAMFRGTSAALKLEWELGDHLTARSITGYRTVKKTANLDLDGTRFHIVEALQETTDDFYSQELQLLGGDSRFNWVAGVYFGYETGNDSSLGTALPALSAGTVTIIDGDVESRSAAGFGQFNWAFAERWSLTLGARYSSERKELVSANRASDGLCNIPPELLDSAGVCRGTFKETFSDPSWLASVQYAISDDVNVYAKYTRGFRAGGQNIRGSTFAETFAAFEPETVTEYEIGLKSQWFDRRLTLNTAFYHDRYTDVQRTILLNTGGIATAVTNAAKAELQGFEAELRLFASDRLSFGASVGYNDAEYDEFTDFTGDRTGEDWPTPAWTYVLSAHFEQPITFGHWSLQLDYNWQDDLNMQPSGQLRSALTQESYGLLNARLALHFAAAGVDVALFGRNLTDEEYYVSGTDLEVLGFDQRFVGNPRTYGIEFRKTFGG
jgi:iron complex outermembrane receptor protein